MENDLRTNENSSHEHRYVNFNVSKVFFLLFLSSIWDLSISMNAVNSNIRSFKIESFERVLRFGADCEWCWMSFHVSELN
jgi:hypothetical protein